MYYPTIVVEDFFKDYNSILNFYKKVKLYKPKKNENWPGVRSKPFHKINIDLHNYIINKIISIYYNYNLQQVFWKNANVQFHKVKPFDLKTWNKKQTHIHKDKNFEIAGVIYLNKNITCKKSGTTIYHNNLKEQIVVSNNFNSLLLYDANKFHGVTKFTDLETLRIVIFINGIKTNNNFLNRLHDN